MKMREVIINLIALYANSFQTCSPKSSDFNGCLTKAITNALSQLQTPLKSYNIPSLEPLEIPSMFIGAGKGAVGFGQNYTNLKISGVTKPKSSQAEFDFTTKKLVLRFSYTEIILDFHYNIDGKILLLKITGDGPGTIKLIEPKLNLEFTLEEFDKNGKKFYKISQSSFEIDPQLITFELENLFGGDEKLAKPVLEVFNVNWKDLWADVKDQYNKAFNQIWTGIFTELLKKVSASELFPEA